MKNSIVSGTLATIVGGVVVLIVQNYYFANEDKAGLQTAISIPSIEISLNGSNNDLLISNGGSRDATGSLGVLGSNVTREISIGQNQLVTLTILGSNNEVTIDKSIFPNVSVSEIGSNNSVFKTFK